MGEVINGNSKEEEGGGRGDKEKYTGKLGFPEGLEGQTKTTLKGRGRGIFWNNTL